MLGNGRAKPAQGLAVAPFCRHICNAFIGNMHLIREPNGLHSIGCQLVAFAAQIQERSCL